MSLYAHSLAFGFKEARLVTPVLDVVKYRAFYPDLDKASGDNWELYIRHYFENGINEGRKNFTDFDAETYLSMNKDLKNTFGDDLVSATRHYIEFGIAEGRVYQWPEVEEDSEVSGGSSVSDGLGAEDITITEILDDGSYMVVVFQNSKISTASFYNTNNVMTKHDIYNEDGLVSISNHYDEVTGTPTYQYTYTYDDRGNIIQSEDIDLINDLTITQFAEYDDNGNQIKASEYHNGELSFSYENTYNALNQVTKSVEFSSANSIIRTKIYEYYESGLHKSEISYYGDTQIIENEVLYYESGGQKSDISYDMGGRIISEIYYDESGREIDAPTI